MSADFTSHCICLTSITIPLCGPVHRVQSIKQVRGSLLSGLWIRFQSLNLLQLTGLKSLSIYLFLLARLNLGLQMDRLPVQASQEALCLERERERGERKKAVLKTVSEPTCPSLCCRSAGCFSNIGTYLPGTVLRGCRLYKWCRNLPALHCVTVMQAVKVVSEPTCRALCYSGADCLSNVGVYLSCTVLQGCRLFQQCLNLPAWHCVAVVQAVEVVSEPTCRALCYSGAGCLSIVRTYLACTVLQGCRLYKRCRNLPDGHCVTVVQAV